MPPFRRGRVGVGPAIFRPVGVGGAPPRHQNKTLLVFFVVGKVIPDFFRVGKILPDFFIVGKVLPDFFVVGTVLP